MQKKLNIQLLELANTIRDPRTHIWCRWNESNGLHDFEFTFKLVLILKILKIFCFRKVILNAGTMQQLPLKQPRYTVTENEDWQVFHVEVLYRASLHDVLLC